MNAPTPKQSRTLDVIVSLTLMHGQAPTQAQLAAVLGITRQAACERLVWMRKKGLVVVRHDRWSRSSRLTREGAHTVAQSCWVSAETNSAGTSSSMGASASYPVGTSVSMQG